MEQKRSVNYLLLVIIGIGFLLRITGINFGLPYTLHSDEPIIVNHAISYGTGDLNPHFFTIPPFCSYLVFACYGLYFVLGKIAGLFPDAQGFAFQFFKDPSFFYLIARMILGILPGVLTIWLVSFLYEKLFSKKGSWYSAAIIAFSFLAVINSHYAYVDNITVAFILSAYIFMADMIEKPSLKNYLISAALLALAISSKYNAGLLAVSFFMAHITAVRTGKGGIKKIFFNKYLFFSIGIVFLVFILTNPFSVLDWRFFLSSVPGKIRSAHIGWTHHIAYSMHEALGWGLIISALAGAVAIFLKERISKGLFLFSFPVLFYLHLVVASQRFSRYVLPLLPFIAIAAAYLFFEIILPKTKTRFQRILVVLLAIALVAPTTVKSVKADMLFCSTDTRVFAAEWIEQNVPPLTKIAVDHSAFRPPIRQSRQQVLEKYKLTGAEKNLASLKEKKLDYTLRALEDKKTYNVYFLARSDKKKQFLFSEPSIARDITSLNKEGIEYITINYNDYNELKENLIKDIIASGAEVVAQFSPYYGGFVRGIDDHTDLTFMNIGAKELFSRHRTGPCIVVYKLRIK